MVLFKEFNISRKFLTDLPPDARNSLIIPI